MIRHLSFRPLQGLLLTAALACGMGITAAGAATPAGGSGQAVLLATTGDWGAYASGQGRSKVCYALSQPKQRLPQGLNRDPAYLFVSTRPAENVRNEISLVMGFPTKEGVDAEAVIDDASFALVTKETNAWVKNPAEEPRVLAAFKAGAKLVVKSQSRRGSKLSDEYSLKGFTQALERATSECAR
jgi:invasion protein IalB